MNDLKAMDNTGVPGERYNFGYSPDPAGCEEFVKSLPAIYGDQLDDLKPDMDRSAFPYRHIMKHLAGTKHIRSGRLLGLNQLNLGSCVGFGTAGAVTLTMCGDIDHRKEPERMPQGEGVNVRPAPGYCYAASRHVSGRLGRWEGSTGHSAARAMREWGVVFQRKYGNIDLTDYSVDRTRGWQNRGVPKTLIDAAAESKFEVTARVKSFSQAVALVQNSYGINMCCMLAWNGPRDSDGFVRVDGSWAHSTTSGLAYVVVGNRSVSGPRGSRFKKRGIANQNSWHQEWKGTRNGGPLGSQTPDLPWQSWIIYEDDYERALAGGDTFAYGGFDGFVAKRKDWIKDWT